MLRFSMRKALGKRIALCAYCALASVAAETAELPVPCVGGSCQARGILNDFDTSLATYVRDETRGIGTVNQLRDNVVLNWRSFNISRDGTVNFVQPSASSVALNRIFDNNVSLIQGALNSNGRVYLLNQNGVVFGQGARVNVGGLIASSLDVSPEALDRGLALAAAQGAPAFRLYRDENGNELSSGSVRIEAGAEINARSGGEVFVFAPNVDNQGTIRTPDGQAILAAGDKVYLAASDDPNLRGLFVEVGLGGTVKNGDQATNANRDVGSMVGQIIAERGNITLAGIAVNQEGRLTATTSVRANGSIRLLARDGGSAGQADPSRPPVVAASRGGDLVLGEGSVTNVDLDASNDTTVDANEQLRSSVELDGRRVSILRGSRIVAPGGNVIATARSNPQQNTGEYTGDPGDTRLYVAPDALIDVSGTHVELPMERNVVRVELRGNELRDSPVQRDGVLRGQAVFVDIRDRGTRADGSTWQGSPIGDVSGAISNIPRNVRERNLSGGSVLLAAQGDVIVDQRATIDISGGSIRYQDGYVRTSQLRGEDGRIYDISAADPLRLYTRIVSGQTARDQRWGVSQSYEGVLSSPDQQFERGYVEGKDAGQLHVLAPRAILDGNVRGDVIVGQHQRFAPTQLPTGQLYRAFDQVPLGGKLIIGDVTPDAANNFARDLVAGGIDIERGLVLPGLLNADGSAFDPLRDPLPASIERIRLRPELIGESGVSRVALYSNDDVNLPATEQLTMPAGGEFSVDARAVRIDGDIEASGGRINVQARSTRLTDLTDPQTLPSIHVGSASVINTRGRWINDNPMLNEGVLPPPVWIDGGEIRLSATDGGLSVAQGALFDVSGGAWRSASGAITGGRAGTIALTAENLRNVESPVAFDVAGELRGYALSRGGTLSLTGYAFCISLTTCTDETAARLAPSLFQSGGFADFRIKSNFGGIEVAPGTEVTVRQQNFEFTTDPGLVASAMSLDGLARTVLLPVERRRAANLSLTTALLTANPYIEESFADASSLIVGTGAFIQTDAGARVTLQSNSRILLDGRIGAPAGAVSLLLDSTLSTTAFLPSQGIWLGANGTIDVSGTFVATPNERGLTLGEVLRGGSVSITAQRGYIVALPGSALDVSGTAAMVDVRSAGGGYTRKEIGSAAGSISLTAAEGMLLAGAFDARGGGADLANGSLTVVLDPSNRRDPGSTPLLPGTARRVIVTDSDSAAVVAPGVAVPAHLNGQAIVSQSLLDSGGFDEVTLVARPVIANYDGLEQVDSLGEIVFDGDVQLTARSRLILDAQRFDVAGSNATLRASYVALTNTHPRRLVESALPTHVDAGNGRLQVNANLIELIGKVAIEGTAVTRLETTGDIRARGVAIEDDARFFGHLLNGGDLELSAAQIYPTTLSDFAFRAGQADTGAIRISGGSGQSTPILSAAGRLTFEAATIEQGGTVRAPLGQVTFRADDLRLQPGSLTSTTAAGATIPFGTTQGGFDWAYQVSPSRTVIFGANGQPVPEQRVVLEGARTQFMSGATVDVSGGGDLLAYEFIPGVGGSKDVLGADVRPDQFAIVPSVSGAFAPYDGSAYAGSTLRPGDSVYLSGIPGLPAGTYALLPARYALLPGAYLVSAVSGYQDILPGETYQRLDGSTVVSGYRTIAGTNVRDARTSGFAVRSGASARKEAQYTEALANNFFQAQSQRLEVPAPRLPRDAGRLAFLASEQLDLAGQLRASVATSGRGAAVDVSASSLRVVSGQTTSTDGAVLVDAGQLSALGAESVLLGGTRSQGTTGTTLSVTAGQVVVDANVTASARELVLAARDTVTVQEGAEIRASGTLAQSDQRLLIDGDAALLRVSQGAQTEVIHEYADGAPRGVQGVVDLRAGSRIVADGSVTLDASRDASSLASFDIAGASLSLGSSRISLGDVGQPVQGLVLTDDQLAGLGVAELVLASQSTIYLYGSFGMTSERLVLSAQALRAGADVDARISAKEISLTNPFAAATPDLAGTGRLNMTAETISLERGAVAIAGFSQATLSASSAIVARGDGSLTSAADLTFAAPRVTADSGRDYVFNTSGSIAVLSQPGSPAALAAALGGRLEFVGREISHQGTIDVPAGEVELRATGGNIVLAANSIINTAGVTRTFDGVDVAATGGNVKLSSATGDVRIEAGSRVDVSGAADGAAGRVTLTATSGEVLLAGDVRGRAAASERSGEVIIDAQRLGDFNALTRRLNDGGFFARRSMRQRGAGDVTIATGTENAVRAHRFDLTVDQGALRVDGDINAAGARGGIVELAARDTIVINGSIDASAQAAGGRGGQIELGSSAGGVLIESGARLAVAAGATVGVEAPRPGRVHVRANRDAVLSVLDATPEDDRLRLAGTISGAGVVTIEGRATYLDADGTIDAGDIDAAGVWRTEADAFMQNAPQVMEALGLAGNSAYQLVPGVEVQSTSDLRLATNWDLSTWRFNDAAGILSLRAAGSLFFDNSLSDGFASVTSFLLPNVAGPSWSYELAAGADLSSSNAMALLAASELAPGAGNLTVAAGTLSATPTGTSMLKMIRTGTGSIDIATAGDLTLGNRASVIYTAGQAGSGRRLNRSTAQGGIAVSGQGLAYPTMGGDIRIDARGDIKGAATNQLVTNWLWRTGGPLFGNPSIVNPTAWTVNFQRFEQGVGALGGGDVTIEAGRDITNLSASIPSIGRQVGANDADNRVEVVGGGTLDMRAGRDIRGGSLYVGLGRGDARAGGEIGQLPAQAGSTVRGLAPVLALGDAAIAATARRGLAIETVVNPTLLPQGLSQTVGANRSFFSTYGKDSSVRLAATAGDMRLLNESAIDAPLARSLSSVSFIKGTGETAPDLTDSLRLYAPSLRATAFSGDAQVGGSFALFPSPAGNLELFAEADVALSSPVQGNQFRVILSDADPDLLPGVLNPSAILGVVTNALNSSNRERFNAEVPVHSRARQANGEPDRDPMRIVARSGSVRMQPQGGNTFVYSAKPARVVAGLDILDLGLISQNLEPTDVTSVIAGRNLTYSVTRGVDGRIETTDRAIAIDGPGRAEFIVGGSLDLQASGGISSRGNTVNSALPDSGASISVFAGVRGEAMNTDAFITRYLELGTGHDTDLIAYIEARTGEEDITREEAQKRFEQFAQYRRDLVAYVQARSGQQGFTEAQALELFRGYSDADQRGLIERVFYSELRFSGRVAAAEGPRNQDYARGFTAVETLFPGANPDVDAGKRNPYTGDINLFFSRIYTLNGGDVSLFAPGGEINAGLAAPPTAFGIQKQPSQLGIVAQRDGSVNSFSYGDFAVNESRVFAADGGDILVWATRGDIDAGRGAKTAISAPPPRITIDQNGQVKTVFPPALTGSGIQTLATSTGKKPGNVDLIAPRGVVNAGDAGIVAGNLTIAATAVLGQDNIQVSGIAVGVPVDTGGLGASLSSVSAAAGSAAAAATAAIEAGAGEGKPQQSLAQAALSWLEVFVVGLGQDNCRPDDVSCLKQQRPN